MKNYFSLIFLFIIFVCFVCGGIALANKKDRFLFGYAPMVVTTSSMEPNYHVNSLIIIKKVDFSKLNVGDPIVFKSTALNGQLAFHRIVRKTDEGFYTKGDKNKHEDNQLITRENYVGKSTYHVDFIAKYLKKINTFKKFVYYFVLPIVLSINFILIIRLFIKKGD